MSKAVKEFYDELAANYHLLFADWNGSIERQATAISAVLEDQCAVRPGARVLDCACGIGTQALGLAGRGFQVTASDVSPAAIDRLRSESSKRNLTIRTVVADLLTLETLPEGDFDAVICMDNALPHLRNDDELLQAATQVRRKLRPGASFLGSIRDYDALVREHPMVQGPSFFTDKSGRRIIHQVWDWLDERHYGLHIYITSEVNGGWESRHYASQYRAVLRQELEPILRTAGFHECQWIFPDTTGFYQPIFIAR